MSNNVNQVKEILNITNTKLDSYLEFCENNITNKILDYCNINEIPERLNSLIQEFLIEQYNLNQNGIGEGKQEITSVKDKEQTVSFQNIGGASSMSKNAEQFLNKNISSLVVYRKLRWDK